jgi:hypothetical protein
VVVGYLNGLAYNFFNIWFGNGSPANIFSTFGPYIGDRCFGSGTTYFRPNINTRSCTRATPTQIALRSSLHLSQSLRHTVLYEIVIRVSIQRFCLVVAAAAEGFWLCIAEISESVFSAVGSRCFGNTIISGGTLHPRTPAKTCLEPRIQIAAPLVIAALYRFVYNCDLNKCI